MAQVGIWIVWALSLLLSTVFMSIYIRKVHKSEGIIAVYVIYLALSQILALKIVKIGIWEPPAGVLTFPFLFQLTDTMNEHFGQKETHKMVFIAFITQILMVMFIFFANELPAGDSWWVSPDAWLAIFQQQTAIVAASWITFLLTNNLDAVIFTWVKKLTKGKYLWVRSIFSDVPMLMLDSAIFITLGFGLFQGLWFLVWELIVAQTITKWIFGVVDTPFIYLDRWIVNSSKLSKFFGEYSSVN
ncbi:queuosine precursor transporter [Candidatus Harpocratesius sp.]